MSQSDADQSAGQHSSPEVMTRLVQENNEKIKLGMLLVNLGVARKEEVFPQGIERKQQLHSHTKLDGKRSSNKSGGGWFSWFSFGSGDSKSKRTTKGAQPGEGVIPPIPQKPTVDPVEQAQKEMKDMQMAEHEKQHAEKSKSLAAAAAVAAERAAAAEKKKIKPNYGLLSEAQANALPAEVAQDRHAVFESEEMIHGMLQSIERTRYQYLTPSPNPICDNEITAVTKCYENSNASFDKKLNAGKLQFGDVHEDILLCAEVVEQLKKCATGHATAYTKNSAFK